jgi:beta-glucanase (GH16 family)
MSARRMIAGSALALVMPASLLLAVGASSATTSTTESQATAPATAKRKAKKQRVSIQALPQIVQQGKRPARAAAAQVGITATIKPAKIGRTVQLQVQRGSSWKTVSKLKQREKHGRVEFGAKASASGSPLTYRVQAAKYKGLGKVTSDAVSTEKWLNASWTDEFTGRSLGADWSHRGVDYEPTSLRRCSKGSPKAVKVRGGTVRLSVIKDKSKKSKCATRVRGKITGKHAYRLNGHIGTSTRQSFEYGFAAARIKTHKLRGQHSSFWLLPEPGNWPGSKGHEIDVIEYFGDKHPQGGLTSFLHWFNGNKLTKTGSWIRKPERFLKNRKDGWSKSYHVFSVEWTPNQYIFRIDGQETWRTSRVVSTEPQYAVLSLLASDYEIPLIKDKKLPQHMYVDWIRFWQDPSHVPGT